MPFFTPPLIDITQILNTGTPIQAAFKYILNELPGHGLNVEQFKLCALASKGYGRASFTDGYKYSIMESSSPFDYYLQVVLKHHYPDIENRLYTEGRNKLAVTSRLYHSLLKFCSPNVTLEEALDDQAFKSCFYAALDELDNLIPEYESQSVDDGAKTLPQNTSAGYSFPGMKKGAVYDDAINLANVQQNILCGLDSREWKRYEQNCFLGILRPWKLASRGHLSSKYNNKTRPVWLVDYPTGILEAAHYLDLFKQMFLQDNTFKKMYMAGDKVMEELFEFLSRNGNCHYANTDASAWDATVPRFVIRAVFRILNKKNRRYREFKKCIDALNHQFIYTPVLLPDGSVIYKKKGVPSGSFLTSLINSTTNFVMTRTCQRYLEFKHSYSTIENKYLGDDHGFTYVGDFDIDEYITLMGKFGIKIKKDSTLIVLGSEKDNIDKRKFIGYTIERGKLMRDDYTWVELAFFTERPVTSLSISFSRMFSYYLLGGCNSELYCDIFNKYISGYYEHLEALGSELFNDSIGKNQTLGVFKHVIKFDPVVFRNMSLSDVKRMFFLDIPYMYTRSIPITYIFS